MFAFALGVSQYIAALPVSHNFEHRRLKAEACGTQEAKHTDRADFPIGLHQSIQAFSLPGWLIQQDKPQLGCISYHMPHTHMLTFMFMVVSFSPGITYVPWNSKCCPCWAQTCVLSLVRVVFLLVCVINSLYVGWWDVTVRFPSNCKRQNVNTPTSCKQSVVWPPLHGDTGVCWWWRGIQVRTRCLVCTKDRRPVPGSKLLCAIQVVVWSFNIWWRF